MRRIWTALFALGWFAFVQVDAASSTAVIADVCAPDDHGGAIAGSFRFSTPGLLEPPGVDGAIQEWNKCTDTPRLSRHHGDTHVEIVRGIGGAESNVCASYVEDDSEIVIWFHRDDSKPEGVGRRKCGDAESLKIGVGSRDRACAWTWRQL